MRLSVSDLDAYLYWRGSEDADLGQLLRRLRREEPPTMDMLAGRAFHKVLENGLPGEVTTVDQDGFRFIFTVDASVPMPVVAELKGEKVYQTPVGSVTLVGVVDGLDGLTIRDYKLSAKFDAERYAESYQWRCYLSMFRARVFDYMVFVGYCELGDYMVEDYHPLTLYAYEGMDADVARAVSDFAVFVAHHLPERQAA